MHQIYIINRTEEARVKTKSAHTLNTTTAIWFNQFFFRFGWLCVLVFAADKQVSNWIFNSKNSVEFSLRSFICVSHFMRVRVRIRVFRLFCRLYLAPNSSRYSINSISISIYLKAHIQSNKPYFVGVCIYCYDADAGMC